jgi:hypothetical protein
MSISDENQKTELAIPPFLKRWSILFRHFPYLLWDVRFLFDVIIKRKPIYWNNVMKRAMKYQKEHPFCKLGAHTEECRKEVIRRRKEAIRQSKSIEW